MKTLYKLWLWHNKDKLGSQAFYPLPQFIKNYLNKFPMYDRVVKYSRILKGADMSMIAPDEYGCAESVTRLLRNLNPSVPVITYTPTLSEYMKKNKDFIQIDEHLAKIIGRGVIIIAPTQPNVQVGHVGVIDGNIVWSNHSYGQDWSNYWSWFAFKNNYKKLNIEYYLPV